MIKRIAPESVIILSTLLLVPVSIDLNDNFSPFNGPKLLLMTMSASLLFPLLVHRLLFQIQPRNLRIVSALATLVLFWMSLSLILNDDSLDERIFGIYGRNLGALTFVSTLFIFLGSLFFEQKLQRFLAASTLISVFCVSTYFTMQKYGLDFIAWEDIYSGTPSSTLGNPNYVSSLIAMSLAFPLTYLILSQKKNLAFLLLSFSTLSWGAIILVWTNAVQGFLITIATLIILISVRWPVLTLKGDSGWGKGALIVSSSLLLALFVFLDLPSKFLRSNEVVVRLDYWRASIRMIEESPILGFGFDSFGDYYLKFRDMDAVTRSAGLFTDSPHNIVLELANYLGLPAAILYILLALHIAKLSFTYIKRVGHSEKVLFLPLFCFWIGFHIQSMLNPSSLVMLTLGSIYSGVLFSIVSRSGTPAKIGNEQNYLIGIKRFGNSFTYKIGMILLSTVLLTQVFQLGYAPLKKDRAFADAAREGDGGKLIWAAESWPFVYALHELTARTLLENGYSDLALPLAKEMTEINPRNIRGWKLISEISSDVMARSDALLRMRSLDPLNPELKP